MLDLIKVIRAKDHEPPVWIKRKLEEDGEYWSSDDNIWQIVTSSKIHELEQYLMDMKHMWQQTQDETVGARHLFDGALCNGDGNPRDCLMRHYIGTRAQKP